MARQRLALTPVKGESVVCLAGQGNVKRAAALGAVRDNLVFRNNGCCTRFLENGQAKANSS